MKEFALIFRNSVNPDVKASPEQMQKLLNDWMDWMGSIAAQDKLVSRGARLSMSQAKTVDSNHLITDGPYTEIKEYINGFIIVKTSAIEEALDLAKRCPILNVGGKVEVREVVSPDDNS